ncbi:EamA family transporter [Horticoccus sp. 23ND18S-11]|uniref:EamA family transporter n=1 Tax=Horticoccus sp. 23ND18S-11 TaxID=3391832 RepID=UPI0039C8F761
MVQLIVVSLIWAFSFGLIKRHLVGVDSTFVAAARLGLALLVFLPFLRLRAINVRLAVSLAAIGALQFGFMYLAYIESFRYLKAYEVGLFTITTPIFVTLFADALDRTLRGRALLAAVLAVIGTAFVTVRSSDLSLTLTGLALVQASNAAFAIGQVLYRRVRARHADLRDRDGFGLLYAGAFAVALTATLARGVHPTLTGPQIGTLLYLGVLASGVGFFLWNVGATRVSAGTLAVMNNAKVPLAVAVALIVFGEQANLPALLASFACLAAAVWLAQSQPAAATRAQRT